MKKPASLLLWSALFLATFLSSCFHLNEDLYDVIEKENYYADRYALMAAILRPYQHAQWAETNFSFWLQELPADQLVITQKQEHWEDGGVWRMIHQHTWDIYEKNAEQTWNACYGGIGYCNAILHDIDSLSYTQLHLEETDKHQHRAELTVLRAYFQLILLDAFRHPAISLDTKSQVGSATPEENFRFIEQSIRESIEYLPKAPLSGYEGRLTQGAAAMLLMRLYLNASWYIDRPMWEETAALCRRLLDGEFGSYTLTDDWTDLWNAGNDACPEVAWSFPQDKQHTYDDFYYRFFTHYLAPEHFGNSTDYPTAYNGCHLCPSYSPSGEPYTSALGRPFSKYPDTDNRKKNFRCISPGKYEGLFLFGPQQVYNRTDYQNGTEEWGGLPLIFIDQVAHFSAVLSEAEKRDFTESLLASPTPYIICNERFRNLSSDSRNGEENSGIRLLKYPVYPTGDAALKGNSLVVLRITEVYYTLAEACMRLGRKAEAEALLNRVRKRYYTASDWPEVRYPEDGSRLDEQEMLDEWGREFLGEKRRRSDLIRFGLFTSGSWWDKKPSESYRRFFPIPAKAVSSNPLLKRSEGYVY